MITDDSPHEPTGIVEDDRLRLIFTCCHPALAPEARVALTLRLLGGLTVAEIAQAFLVPETTMAQRITRAKKKISVAKIPYRVPSRRRPRPARERRAGRDLPGLQRGLPLLVGRRLAHPRRADRRGDPAGPDPARPAPRRPRGHRPARADAAHRRPPVGAGRRRSAGSAARAGPRRLGPGADRRGSRAGPGVPRAAARRCRPGQYQLLAAINAVHTDAPTADDTDWSQIATLYSQLYDRRPLPDRRAEPSGRRRRARRPGGRAGRGRPTRPGDVPPLARHPCRPAPPARPLRRGTRRRTTPRWRSPTTRPSAATSRGGAVSWR